MNSLPSIYFHLGLSVERSWSRAGEKMEGLVFFQIYILLTSPSSKKLFLTPLFLLLLFYQFSYPPSWGLLPGRRREKALTPCASVGWAASPKVEGPEFDSQSEHVPGCLAMSPAGWGRVRGKSVSLPLFLPPKPFQNPRTLLKTEMGVGDSQEEGRQEMPPWLLFHVLFMIPWVRNLSRAHLYFRPCQLVLLDWGRRVPDSPTFGVLVLAVSWGALVSSRSHSPLRCSLSSSNSA